MGGDHGRMAIADWKVTAKSGLSCYLWKIQRFPMMEPHEEYVLAKRWREHGDHEAAHKLVNSHLRLVAKIARGYGSNGLPISDLISLAEHDVLENRRKALSQALDVLNERERRIFEELCLAEGQTSSASTTCTRSE
jgi:DNA-directed RNA polymerase sigma subunit (sigma70/sigma32)